MSYDEGIATVMREDLRAVAGIAERKMFGGLAFMLRGNMVCGTHRHSAMFRVGPDRAAEALAIPGTRKMAFDGRPMGGMIEAAAETMAEDLRRGRLLALALEHARALPAK